MIWIEYADDIIAQIKEALPPNHEMQMHEIFPGIKWERRPIFIVDDDTTGQRILMNFEKMIWNAKQTESEKVNGTMSWTLTPTLKTIGKEIKYESVNGSWKEKTTATATEK